MKKLFLTFLLGMAGVMSAAAGPGSIVVTNISSTSVRISWNTASACDTIVAYGVSATCLGTNVYDVALVQNHAVTLTALTASTAYCGSINGNDDYGDPVASNWYVAWTTIAVETATPTDTRTATPTKTPTKTNTGTPSFTRTVTKTITQPPVATLTPTRTWTFTKSATRTVTSVMTATPAKTATITPTPTSTYAKPTTATPYPTVATTPVFEIAWKNVVVHNPGGASGDPLPVIGNQNSPSDGEVGENNLVPVENYGMRFNGRTWDRVRGDTNGSWAQGSTPTGAVSSANPLPMGGVGRSTLPNAVTDGAMVYALFTKSGKLVTVADGPRETRRSGSVTLTAATEQTLVTAGVVGVYHDMTLLVITNSGTNKNVVWLRDVTAGTPIMPIAIAAGGGAVIPFNPPLAQTTAQSNWTVQATDSPSGGSIFCSAIVVKNK